MADQLRTYRVQYLLPYRKDAAAREDKNVPGFFHHEEILVAETRQELLDSVAQVGGIPVRLADVKPGLRIFSSLSADYKQQFLKAIEFNCSKMSANKALEAVIESESGDVRVKLEPALAIIKRGGGFVEALGAMNAYDESTLAILEAGERTGAMKESLKTAAEYLEAKKGNMKLMMGIVSYLLFEVISALSAMMANRFGILPHIAKSVPVGAAPEKVENIKRAIQYATVMCDVMMWGTIAVLFFATLAAYSYFDKDKRVRDWVDKKVASLPYLGKAILHSAVENSFKVAASLIKGGVHYDTSLEIAEKSSRVPAVISFWSEAKNRAERGDSIATTLKQRLLDNSDQLLIEAHSDANQLAFSLKVIADRRNLMAKTAARNFGYLSFAATVIYTTLSVLGSLYVLWIQNESLISGMNG